MAEIIPFNKKSVVHLTPYPPVTGTTFCGLNTFGTALKVTTAPDECTCRECVSGATTFIENSVRPMTTKEKIQVLLVVLTIMGGAFFIITVIK